jgi:hypothetical protein
MISSELRARIRRLFYAEHWKVGTIATQLSVHRETVMLAIEADRFQTRAGVVYPSQLDPYKAFIVEQLEQYPRLRATRIFAMVRERGYAGSEVVVRRYVRTVRPASSILAQGSSPRSRSRPAAWCTRTRSTTAATKT